jgi:predicted O-methyltransferase YrrM
MLERAFQIEGLTKVSELESLHRLAASMPDNARVVEIGSWKGRSAVAIRLGLPASARLWCVDTFRGDDDTYGTGLDHSAIRQEFDRNTAGLDIAVIEAESVVAAGEFEDRSLDWVFIDADHSYTAVRSDIAAWAPKLRPEGLLSGHDYGRGGVTPAVRRVLGDLTVEGSVWLTRERPRLRILPAARAAAGRMLRR